MVVLIPCTTIKITQASSYLLPFFKSRLHSRLFKNRFDGGFQSHRSGYCFGGRDGLRSYREVIERLNTQIARLITTIRTLRRAVSNLQDFAFDAQDNKLDPDFVPKRESDDTAEDSE